jgi:4'-phosphopantetheinyl transferase
MVDMHLDSGTVHIWWADLADSRPDLAGLLDTTERQRHAAFLRPEDRARFALGCTLVKLSAAAYLDREPAEIALDRGCTTCGRPHGKPRIPGTELEVSVSHSGARIGVAAHWGAPVGLDVEEVAGWRGGPPLWSVLAPAEAALLRPLPVSEQPAVFLRYWVRKEAVVKMTGDGLLVDLATVVVGTPAEPAAVQAWPGRPDLAGQLSLHDLVSVPGYPAALAIGRPERVAIRELDARQLLDSAPPHRDK